MTDPDSQAQRAYEALQRGDAAAARALCREILDRHPDHPGALFALGLTETQDGRHEDALAAFERAAAIAPGPEALVNLARARYQLGRLDPAAQAARAALAADPAHGGALSLLAAALHGLERYEEALKAALEAARLAPASDVACARVGSTLERLGRLAEAEARFREAERLGGASKPYSLVSFDGGLLERMRNERPNLATEITPRLEPRESAGCRLVGLTCCDSKYFARYGFNFVHSFARNAGPDSLLHAHIVDPDAALDETLDRIARQIGPARFLVTTERSPFAGQPESIAAHTYFSCCRFLGMPAFMERHRKPIALLDVDAIVEGPFDAVMEAVSGNDIGLVRRDVPHSPWLDLPAWFLLANPTDGARRYFDLVRDYVLHFMGRGEFRWHLDQAALYCVLRTLEDRDAPGGGTLAARLLKTMLPWSRKRLPAPPSVKWMPEAMPPLWELGHSAEEKLGDPRFTRYSPRA